MPSLSQRDQELVAECFNSIENHLYNLSRLTTMDPNATTSTITIAIPPYMIGAHHKMAKVLITDLVVTEAPSSQWERFMTYSGSFTDVRGVHGIEMKVVIDHLASLTDGSDHVTGLLTIESLLPLAATNARDFYLGRTVAEEDLDNLGDHDREGHIVGLKEATPGAVVFLALHLVLQGDDIARGSLDKQPKLKEHLVRKGNDPKRIVLLTLKEKGKVRYLPMFDVEPNMEVWW
jgi:hypothetical protein